MNTPILVTGSHRSGTTWAGRMLATAPGVAYIHEPFNLDHDPAVCDAPFRYWYTYVCEANEREFLRPVLEALSFRYHLGIGLRRSRSSAAIRRELRRYGRSLLLRAAGARPLVKDPIALFSAEWLAETFGVTPVVMIRHPAAFAGSLKVKHWVHPFSHFLSQPLLMSDRLRAFDGEIREFAAEEKDIVDQAALLWRIIHQTILEYRENHRDWIFVRHEDLSRDPIGEFRRIFERLGLPFTEGSRAVIMRHSFPEVAARESAGVGIAKLKRDSRDNIASWRERLTAEEVERVRNRVAPIAANFYSDAEWSMGPTPVRG